MQVRTFLFPALPNDVSKIVKLARATDDGKHCYEVPLQERKQIFLRLR
jgi:hypothetical protein